MEQLWDSYIDGGKDFTHEQLMRLADSKYKERVQADL
jgi:hypothetical protein